MLSAYIESISAIDWGLVLFCFSASTAPVLILTKFLEQNALTVKAKWTVFKAETCFHCKEGKRFCWCDLCLTMYRLSMIGTSYADHRWVYSIVWLFLFVILYIFYCNKIKDSICRLSEEYRKNTINVHLLNYIKIMFLFELCVFISLIILNIGKLNVTGVKLSQLFLKHTFLVRVTGSWNNLKDVVDSCLLNF